MIVGRPSLKYCTNTLATMVAMMCENTMVIFSPAVLGENGQAQFDAAGDFESSLGDIEIALNPGPTNGEE